MWVRGKREYLSYMNDVLDRTTATHGFNIVKIIYGIAYRLEQTIDDPNGIDPEVVSICIKHLAAQVQDLRAWELIKIEQERG